MRNKNGFTLIEMLAVIIILGILIGIATVSYSGYLSSSKDKAFRIAENTFKDAVIEAYIDCNGNLTDNDFCSNHDEPDTKGEKDKIYLYELKNDRYIETLKSPYNTEVECDMNNSYIEVVSNVNLYESNNSDLSYKICLKCDGHSDSKLDEECGF